MWTYDGRTTVILENTDKESIKITLLKEQQHIGNKLGRLLSYVLHYIHVYPFLVN